MRNGDIVDLNITETGNGNRINRNSIILFPVLKTWRNLFNISGKSNEKWLIYDSFSDQVHCWKAQLENKAGSDLQLGKVWVWQYVDSI